jgi:hypothetical protein
MRNIFILFACILSMGLLFAARPRQSQTNMPIPANIPTCADASGQHLNFASGTFTCGTTAPAAPSGTTGAIGGGALLAGAASTGTASIPAATTVGKPCIAAPSDGTSLAALGTGVSVNCSITSSGTATVVVTASIAGTPTAKTYLVTVP